MGNNYSLKIYGMYALRTLKCNIYIGLALKPFASQISRNIGVFFATWRLYLELEPTGRNTTGRNSPQWCQFFQIYHLPPQGLFFFQQLSFLPLFLL